MVKRAMTVVADKLPKFDVWVEEDDEDERGLFESLDFVFTGVEDWAEPAMTSMEDER